MRPNITDVVSAMIMWRIIGYGRITRNEDYPSSDINEENFEEKHSEVMCQLVQISDAHGGHAFCSDSSFSSFRDTRATTDLE